MLATTGRNCGMKLEYVSII